MPASPPHPSDHDPELGRFLDQVVDLSAQRHGRGPDEFLAAAEALVEVFQGLRRYRTEKTLMDGLRAFARKRFELVDEPSEYVLAWDEVMVLSMVLGEAAPLAFPALKQTIERMSEQLGQEGVPALFGQMLKRARQLARQHGDAELAAWVKGVVAALPGEDVSPARSEPSADELSADEASAGEPPRHEPGEP
jgi:hypothetical protein